MVTGECSVMDEATCDARQIAEEAAQHPAPSFDIMADPDPEGLSEQRLLVREDLIEAVVEACEPPSRRPELMRGFSMLCTLRLGIDGSGERLRLTWPWYSHRPEVGHPNFQDPVVNESFWITFDKRHKENVVFHARRIGKIGAHGQVKQ
jgi:hypothetical protein